MPEKKKRREYEFSYKGRVENFDFALLLVIIGLVWLAEDLGYLGGVSIIPLVLILFGSWLILKKLF